MAINSAAFPPGNNLSTDRRVVAVYIILLANGARRCRIIAMKGVRPESPMQPVARFAQRAGNSTILVAMNYRRTNRAMTPGAVRHQGWQLNQFKANGQVPISKILRVYRN